MDRALTGVPVPPSEEVEAAPAERVALVDLLDRLLAGGVVITGDITISIADVDLVRISLRAIIASIRPEMERCVRDVDELAPPRPPGRDTAW
ncbi:gas vesicle protein [Spirillospora sp. CA-255316]